MGQETIIGHGTVFSFGDKADFNDTPVVFTPFKHMESVAPVSPEVDDIDVTDMDSLEGWKEFKGGLKDGGEVEGVFQYEEVQHSNFFAVLLGVTKAYKVLFPDGSDVKFNGHINDISQEDPVDDKIMETVTIKVTGKPVFTQA